MKAIGIQARSGSTRFPGKIYERFLEKSLLETVYDNMQVEGVHTYVLGHMRDEKLQEFCHDKGLNAFYSSASEDDLLARYADFMHIHEVERCVRITSDSPLVPIEVVKEALDSKEDYVTNVTGQTYPSGMDVQCISKKGMQWYYQNIDYEEHLFYTLEHNPEILNKFLKAGNTTKEIHNPYKWILNRRHPENHLSIDTKEDLERVRELAAK